MHANHAAERILGKPQGWFSGRRLLEEMPATREEGLFDAYVKVVASSLNVRSLQSMALSCQINLLQRWIAYALLTTATYANAVGPRERNIGA